MSDIAIRVENISKLYHIGARANSHATLRDQIADMLTAPFRGLRRKDAQSTAEKANTIWALKDTSFEVECGQAVGIIGRNGAGKSTLLKILSRITEPTDGCVEIDGRVGSLLEVGTGFHPELTGRENIYLNGAILGMRKVETDRKFDEIVSFAEVEKFIDTPVKFYSSGMYVRLAFAVAAHLEPEILMVDEVLAVGDVAFQKKCLGKLGNVAKEGRTVLFVSHNLPAIVSLCSRCLLLEQGHLIEDGTPSHVVSKYLDHLYEPRTTAGLEHVVRFGTGKARFRSVTLTPLDTADNPQKLFKPGQNLRIDIEIDAVEKFAGANVGVEFYNPSDARVIDTNLGIGGESLSLTAGQHAHVQFVLQNVLLRPDIYRLALWLGISRVEEIDYVPNAASLTVEVDPEKTKHFEIFPGVYQCAFTHSISIREMSNLLGTVSAK